MSEFPLFSRRYLGGGGASLWKPMDPPPKTKIFLDLKALPRDDGPPSETQLRRQKYQYFEKQCSEVAEGLFLSGDWVARNRELLADNGITHVVNCVGFICKEYFKGELDYKTFYLQDTPAEDILCVLYEAFEFIDAAINSGGRVLVHCSQGVSRSATLVIAYLMWKTGKTYDEVFARVKAIRGVANPNIGFTCQLLQWQKRRNQAPARMRMYRMAPHCQHAPLLLVPRTVTPPKKYATHTWRELDPRGAFIIQTPSQLYVWVGAQCPPAFAAAAELSARLLPKYETVGSTEVVVCIQGSEPEELIAALDPPALDPDAERQNARRASITGDLFGAISFGPSSASGGGGGANMSGPDPMDTEGPGGSAPITSDPAAAELGRGGYGAPAVPFSLPRLNLRQSDPGTAIAYSGSNYSSSSPMGLGTNSGGPVSGLLLSPFGSLAPLEEAVEMVLGGERLPGSSATSQPQHTVSLGATSGGGAGDSSSSRGGASTGAQGLPQGIPLGLGVVLPAGPGSYPPSGTPSPHAPALMHSRSIKARPSPTGPPPWVVGEVDEYSSDYQLYYDAVRAVGNGGMAGALAPGSDLMVGVRMSHDRVRELRHLMTSPEGALAGALLQSSPYMAMGMEAPGSLGLLGASSTPSLSSYGAMLGSAPVTSTGATVGAPPTSASMGGVGSAGVPSTLEAASGVGSGGPLGSPTPVSPPPQGAAQGPMQAQGGQQHGVQGQGMQAPQHPGPLGGAGVPMPTAAALLQAGLMGPVGRPDSPATTEGRLKKYRRAGGDTELAAMMATDPSRRMFPSLHHSIDEEEMPP